MIVIDGNHNVVGNGNELKKDQSKRPPPAGHRNAAYCPQCDGLTWAGTPECVQCGIDRELVLMQREQQYLEHAQVRGTLLMVGLVCIAASVLFTAVRAEDGAFYTLNLWASLFLGAAGVFSVGAYWKLGDE